MRSDLGCVHKKLRDHCKKIYMYMFEQNCTF